MDISSSAVIVTGGASGIGAASARALTKLGGQCVVVDLDEQKGEVLAAELRGVYVKADVAEPDQVQMAVETAAKLGPLRALVNAAGIGHAERTIDRNGVPADLRTFERVIRVNLIGAFNVLRLAVAVMSKTDPMNDDGARGAVVNIASVAAFDGQIGQAAYAASKGGMVGFTLPIARDLAAVGVRVNTIAPGLIDTPIYGQGSNAEDLKSRLAKGVLFPTRFGTPDELASMVVELIVNDYMNGETIRVDGGLRMAPK